MTENREKRNPLIPLMNEGLGELMCRRHFFIFENTTCQKKTFVICLYHFIVL